MKEKVNEEFKVILSDIKNEIKNTQTKIMYHANNELIMLYFRIGKKLEENSKYGNNFIKNLAFEIKKDFKNSDGFSERNLKRMKRFYNEYKEFEKVPQAVALLPWGHNIILFEKLKDKNIRIQYAKAAVKNGWSRSILEFQIKTKYHLRIGNSSNNFKTLPNINSYLVNSIIKDPYIFDFLTLKQKYKEKELENAMIERIKDVLVELGKGFSFVGNQYKISTNNNDYYIDLLFYHLELRCYIVIELKTTEFKPEYIGQLNFYITAVNKALKKKEDNNTIGLLLCKEKDRISVEWSLESINNPIGVSSFELGKYIPKDILEKLPTEEDINLYISIAE